MFDSKAADLKMTVGSGLGQIISLMWIVCHGKICDIQNC